MEHRFKRKLMLRAVAPVEPALRKEADIVPHNFILNAPEAGISVAESLSTEDRDVRFTPARAGTYPFFCGKKPPLFPSHRDEGMEGVLEVLP